MFINNETHMFSNNNKCLKLIGVPLAVVGKRHDCVGEEGVRNVVARSRARSHAGSKVLGHVFQIFLQVRLPCGVARERSACGGDWRN